MSEFPIRVLIVDDAATVRATLVEILSGDPELRVLGAAADPYEAARLMEVEAPDVILLDVEMPRMDGLTFLEKIMAQHPIPVVMCSSFTKEGSATALRALELGAVEIIEKPRIGTRRFFEDSRMLICDVIKSAAQARLAMGRARFCPVAMPVAVRPKLSADVILPSAKPVPHLQETETVVVVGASTGGTEALRVFLQGLPETAPGVVIVIHMPERFTACYAERLDSLCRIRVKEAEDNDTVKPGLALIAPGNRHLLLKRSGSRYYVSLHDGPFVSRHRPAVNVLFRSAARYGGSNIIAVLLTGMGDDGATGMREMKSAGAFNIVQDEASSVVFGMPKEAIKTGAVDRVLPLDRIADEVLKHCHDKPART